MKNYSSVIVLVLMIAVVYGLMILPQRRQQKNRQLMLQRLGAGARVVTAAGIYGQVVSVENDVVHLEIAPDVMVTMDSRAIVRVTEAAPVNEEQSQD